MLRSPAGLGWILLIPLALLFGVALAGNPPLVLGAAAVCLLSFWAITAGPRHGTAILTVYLVALITVPTIMVSLRAHAIPAAASDLALLPLLLALAGGHAAGQQTPPACRSLGRRLFLLNLAILVSVLFLPISSPNPDMAASLLRFLRFAPALIVFAAVLRFAPARQQVERAVDAITAAIFVQAILGIGSFLFQMPMLFEPERRAEQLIWLRGEVLTRAQGTMAESSSLAHIAGIGCLLALYRLGSRRGRAVLWPLLALSACVVCLVLTYSRGMTLSLCLGVSVFFLFTREGRKARIAAAIATVVVVLVLLNAAGSHYLEFLWNRFATTAYAASGESLDTYLSGRIGMWSRLGQFLQENPAFIVFGIGYKSIASAGPFQATVGDNNYFSMLVECGLFGLAAMLAVLWGCLRGAWSLRVSLDRRIAAAGALLLAVWTMHATFMLVGDAMTYWRSIPVMFFLQFAFMRIGLSDAEA